MMSTFISTVFFYPVMHLQLGGSCQADGPPLLSPLWSVDRESVFGVVQHRYQDGDFINERM